MKTGLFPGGVSKVISGLPVTFFRMISNVWIEIYEDGAVLVAHIK